MIFKKVFNCCCFLCLIMFLWILMMGKVFRINIGVFWRLGNLIYKFAVGVYECSKRKIFVTGGVPRAGLENGLYVYHKGRLP